MCLLLGLFIQYAQASNNVFVKYSKSEGLVQNTVTNSLEDHHGFMWFSTYEGLSRFDGYEFKNYRHSNKDPYSLPNNLTVKLLLDSSGNLWVATKNGLAKYNPLKDNFKNYNTDNSELSSNEIFTIALNNDGNLLVSTAENLYLYDEIADSFLPFTVKGEKLPADIKVIFSEQDKTWLGSLANGIFILEHDSNTLFSLQKANPWDLQIRANYLSDFKKINDTYWLATENGAYLIDANLSSVRLLNTQSAPAIIGDDVLSILQNHNGNIWLGTSTGISILDSNNKLLFSLDSENNKRLGLESAHILSLFRDSNNSIWLGTYSGGLYRYNADSSEIMLFRKSPSKEVGLSGNIIWGLSEDTNGKIWVATQSNGLNRFDLDSLVFDHFLRTFEHNIWALKVDEFNKIWIASSGGLFIYKQSSDTELTLIDTLFSGKDIINLSHFYDRMWLLTQDGIVKWIDPLSLEVHSIDLADNKINYIKPLYVDSDSNLWLDTNLGMVLYNLDTAMVKQLMIELDSSVRHFSSVIEVSNGYWLSSLSQGMVKLDKSSFRIIKQLSDENGLASNTILKTLRFKDSLWVSHVSGGIDEISIESGKVLQNIAPSRLGYNELNEDSGMLSKSARLLFGGTDGILIFSPEDLSVKATNNKNKENQKRKSKAPTITQLRLFNLPISVHSDKSPLIKPINLSTSIDLPNKSTMLSVKFAQLNPVNPVAVKYRYRLLGLSDKWIETDAESSRRAEFSYLDFGSYEFIVQSKNPTSSWSEPTTLKINIAPPFWLARNALILYALLGILILIFWIKQLRAKNAINQSIQENEERLKLTLWSSGDELWDWDIYKGQVFRSNTWGTLDFPQDDIRVNSSYEANIHPNDIQRVQQTLNDHLSEKTEHYEITYRAKTYKGDWIWVLDRGKIVARDINHQPQRMTGTLKNISHLKEADEQLKLFKRSIETISDGVFITDTSFKFISVNNSHCKYTGETREQALASYLTFHQYPGAFTEEVKKSLQQKGNWNGEVESRRAGGEKFEMELNIDAITDEDGKISHYVGVFSDITSRKTTEKELLKLSNTDPLTDLPNRSFFQANHDNIVRRNTQHALLCMDMDNFKKINDSLGHQTGDILIKQIAKRLKKMAGTKATCYRLGGDEFSILIDNSTDIHHITHFAQTILDNMARPFIINKQEFVLGASLGIAFYPEDGSNSQELLKNADTAMYFAKNAGGNKYQFFSGEMNQNAVRQLQIENLIRHGLKEDLFSVFYQPKVDIASGKLVSMEALVRYEHPEKGLVSPAQFIPLAEQTGQIVDIGEVVLKKACEDTKRWVDAGLFTGRVAVNIAARQFEIPDLDERIMNILQKSGLSALHLECEITEGTLMQSPENALRMMQRLRERGIHLALDDFGTGYSSLAYLKQFPINTLKIDKAFIDDIATSAEDRHMAKAIITIAHNLGLKVVAEGVEYENQLSILRRYQCEMLQGYLYSKPLSAARFERLLQENHALQKTIQSSNI
ncbi:EAL domain-containing protein [uncultured Paraglaciecola sp.]|uniref:EAL domain-containing protein n=1 Tax=uncultured Paraglaciecola sp. TaxID=1765024 RepID=UPI00260885C8|nr:EAL domain-containing protein [uncultured Paraglaciecola sp.]